MNNYFNILPFEILLKIFDYTKLYKSVRLVLLLNDYHSRNILELINSPTYRIAKLNGYFGIKLNVLLYIELNFFMYYGSPSHEIKCEDEKRKIRGYWFWCENWHYKYPNHLSKVKFYNYLPIDNYSKIYNCDF